MNILIVEDEPLVAEDIQIKLKALGYGIAGITDNALEAINQTARNSPDLVIMDIVLAGDIDGIQAASIIRQEFNLPVIYLTAYSDQVFLDRAKITDPMAYIIKPVTERDLHAAISIAVYKFEHEKQLQEKEWLDATLVSLSDPLLVWNLEGEIIRVNHALLNLLRRKEQDLIGREVSDVIVLYNAVDGLAIIYNLIYVIETQGSLKDDRDLVLHCHDKRQVAVRVSGSKILSPNKQCLGYTMLIRDDTERKRQEGIIHESEERFRQLTDHIQSIFYLADIKKQQMVYLSPAYEKIFGRGLAESSTTIHTPFVKHVYPDDQDKAKGLIRSINAQKQCADKFRILRPDGEIRWINTRCYPVSNSETEVGRMACIIDDVTEMTHAEIKLQQAANVFDNTSEGILITDSEQIIVAVNQAFTSITGYSEQDVLGMSPSILESGQQSHSFYQSLWHTIYSTGHWQGEIKNRRKNGEVYPQWMTINAIHDPDGNVINYISIFSDITHIKKSQEKLDYLAHHDHLTGFANRLLFNALLEHAIERAARDHQKVTVVLMDLDRFKEINDSFGHGAGDILLNLLADRLRACLREEDTLARLGGDEFIFILENLKYQEEVIGLAQKIQNIFAEPFRLGSREIIVTASLGICLYPNDGTDATTLIQHADMAMYKAKQQGNNRIAFYTEELDVDNINRLTLATELRQAMDREEFRVHYQPQIRLDTMQIVGAEALIRWQHPEKGGMSPLDFIPFAEETGFIEELGEWILYQACRQCKEWNDQCYSPIVIAVNLSARQFLLSDIVGTVTAILNKTGLSAQYLELEITESGLMERVDKVINLLDDLKSLGVSLSIDDFGTGYSSLSYLKRFPIDKLKIDRSFVKDLPEDEQDAAISRSIIALGKSLNLKILAEGVETEAQRDFMLAEGCQEMQGYLFSKPVSSEEFTDILKLQ